LDWTINLEPEQKWHTDYLLKQVNCTQHEYIFPSAILEFDYNGKHYNISSNTPTLYLYGSRILLNKTLKQEGEEYAITVTVKNTGNRASKVEVKDYIPDGTELLDGVLDFSTVLQPGESYTNNYTIHGNFSVLPPAIAEFYDYNPSDDLSFRHGKVQTESITPEHPQIKPTPTPAQNKTQNIHTAHTRTNTSNPGILSKILGFFKLITQKFSKG